MSSTVDTVTKRHSTKKVLCTADTWLRTQCSRDKNSKERGDRETEWVFCNTTDLSFWIKKKAITYLTIKFFQQNI